MANLPSTSTSHQHSTNEYNLNVNLINQIPITQENVERIVDEFYATSQVTNEFKPQLDQWLKHAQNSKEAWSFSWLLIDMNKTVNCQFYGASCLYNKVSKYLNEVPYEELDLLKNKLLEKLLLYATILVSETNNARQQQVILIERKLNSTLAKLALYLIEDQWQNCIYDIIQTIPNCMNSNDQKEQANGVDQLENSEMNSQKMQLILVVIDLFTLLPEEFSTLSNLTKQKRLQINQKLKTNFFLISKYLINLFNQFNDLVQQNSASSSTNQTSLVTKIIENAIKCLTSWCEFGIQFNEIESFLDYLFVYIFNDKFFEQSAECLTCLFSSEENLKYVNTIFKYCGKVLGLRNLLAKYVHDRDNDGCVVLTKLILSFGENQLSSLFDGLLYGDEMTKRLLYEFMQLIMSLTSMPGNFPVDEESSDLTFVFWYTLQDTLLGIENKSSQLQQIFRPFFINLLETFIVKLQLSNDYDQWSEEDKERLRCYRIDIGDTMVYMISMIGEIMLEFVIKKLIVSIDLMPSEWKQQESLIYMLQSVVSELNESCSADLSNSQDTFLISFVDLLPKINYSNKHILSTTLLSVGSLGSWLERNVHVLPNVISLCLLGLKTESVTQSASFALKDIVNECDMCQYAEQIIQTCQECLKQGSLAHNYEVRLISIIGLCLSDLLKVEMQRTIDWLFNIIEPYVQKLAELSQLQQTDKQTQSLTCHIINLLSQLMSSLIQRQQSNSDLAVGDSDYTHNNSTFSNHQQQENTSASFHSKHNDSLNSSLVMNRNDEKVMVNSILVRLLPIYKVILKRNLASDVVIVDKLFESISVTLTGSIAAANPSQTNENMDGIVSELIELFYLLNENAWRRYAFEVCRQMLIIWWKTDKFKTVLDNLFIFSHQNAMKLISKDMNWFHEHTDVVEQYSTCLAKLLKAKYYDLFEKLNTEALFNLIRFVQLGLQLPEQYTLRAVATFLEEFIKFSKHRAHFTEFMQQHAFSLIQITIIGISGSLPRHLVDLLAGILYTFTKEYPQLTNVILTQFLINMDFQPNVSQQQQQASSSNNLITTSLSKEQKLIFIRSVSSESNNKRKFKETVNEFSLSCRGLVNTQYAKETKY